MWAIFAQGWEPAVLICADNGVTQSGQFACADGTCVESCRHRIELPVGQRCGLLHQRVNWGIYYGDVAVGAAVERRAGL